MEFHGGSLHLGFITFEMILFDHIVNIILTRTMYSNSKSTARDSHRQLGFATQSNASLRHHNVLKLEHR